jgi:hypothetical protein
VVVLFVAVDTVVVVVDVAEAVVPVIINIKWKRNN